MVFVLRSTALHARTQVIARPIDVEPVPVQVFGYLSSQVLRNVALASRSVAVRGPETLNTYMHAYKYALSTYYNRCRSRRARRRQ